MHKNQNPPMTVPPDGHPPLFRFAVLFVSEGDSYGVPEEFGGTVEADPVLAQILLGFTGVPLKSVSQLYPLSAPTIPGRSWVPARSRRRADSYRAWSRGLALAARKQDLDVSTR